MMRGARKTASRLHNVLSALPGWNAGGGTQSASIAGVVGYATDAAIVLEVARKVLLGLATRDPHPVFGDDGFADAARTEAVATLDWAERWIEWRTLNHWQRTRGLLVGDPLPDNPDQTGGI